MIHSSDEIITTDGYFNFCEKNGLCYIKTDFFYIGQFYWRGKIHPTKIMESCVIGHSDYPVVEQISSRFKKVFCVNKTSNLENTFGIPLGITNDCDDSPRHRIYGNRDIMIDVFLDKTIEKTNLAYINFSINTYPQERSAIFNKFKDTNWVSVGSIEDTLSGRKKYLADIKSSKFVFCPRGNGIDTHRLWETLYMGSYPIVKYENTHHLLTDLPILFIKSWDEVTESFLEEKYNEFINKEWNLDKLKISYWNEFILKNSRD